MWVHDTNKSSVIGESEGPVHRRDQKCYVLKAHDWDDSRDRKN